MPARLHAFLLMMLTALLWSTGGLGIKLADATPLTIGGLRSLFAACVMSIPTALALRRSGSLRSLFKSRYIWGAAVAYVVMVLAFVFAVKWSSAANAILIQYTGPIYVAILSWPVLRERMRAEDWLAAAGCGIGLCVFFRGEIGGEGSHLWGNVLAVLSSFGFGALPIFLKLEQRRNRTPAELPAASVAPAFAMTLGNLLAFTVTLPFIVHSPPKSGLSHAIIALLGVFQIGIPYLLYGIAMQKLRALESSLLACVEPILSPLWVFLVMREVPSHAAILGGSLILASVTLQGVVASRR